MKKIFLSILLCSAVAASAQVKTRTLTKTTELQMARTEDDDYPGTRGASVAWHPLQKKYYAAMAGNLNYPLCVFDATGKRLSEDDESTLIDIRGLWYNPAAKTIQGNGFDTVGWFSYKFDKGGITAELDSIMEGRYQPGQHCTGAFNPVTRKVLFLFEGNVYSYSIADGVQDSKVTSIYWGKSVKPKGTPEEEGITADGYNYTTVVYTGIPKSEYGFLNALERQIELYDAKTGLLTQILKLPDEAEAPESFNFAYTNGIYWIFDMDSRVWYGYK
ncbi:MAG: hypothetical protein U0U70_01210 [Chitinophagaceae bacterium]